MIESDLEKKKFYWEWHRSVSFYLCEHNLLSINTEIISKYLQMSTEHFFLPWPGLADLGWAHSCNWSAGGLAGADCSSCLCSLICLGLWWESWADSAPCSRSSSSRLTWACSHGRSQGLRSVSWNTQGLLRRRLETPLHYFCSILSAQERHVATSTYGSGGIAITPLGWRDSKVTLQHGMQMKRGLIMDSFANTLYTSSLEIILTGVYRDVEE